MRILRLEIKRILKTRVTGILLLAALFLSAVTAYLPVTFFSGSYTDAQGNTVKLKGLAALRYEQAQQADIAGEVTPRKAAQSGGGLSSLLAGIWR